MPVLQVFSFHPRSCWIRQPVSSLPSAYDDYTHVPVRNFQRLIVPITSKGTPSCHLNHGDHPTLTASRTVSFSSIWRGMVRAMTLVSVSNRSDEVMESMGRLSEERMALRRDLVVANGGVLQGQSDRKVTFLRTRWGRPLHGRNVQDGLIECGTRYPLLYLFLAVTCVNVLTSGRTSHYAVLTVL
jgi:hypothetical protein